MNPCSGFNPKSCRRKSKYCLLEGTRLAADCRGEEKREGTLGLLFLTDLQGYDVVLGKYLATSPRSFSCS